MLSNKVSFNSAFSMIVFFAAVNHLNGPYKEQLWRVQKVIVCDLWLVDYNLFLCVSVFQGSLVVIVIMIDGEKCNSESGFWTLEFPCLWKAQ